ncbi:hypothetical protein LWI29_012823 [Acer saccharum]|uniref:Uncharacterized protein n=1 Tax=Acer saccharum TaxID=4024 RepID=A0AA39W8W9_ACESA|nr:hypothetical protein LWI29_012823 [Acer saccharum]
MKNTTDIDDLFAEKNSPDELMPKEFISALDSLVDSLAQPRSEIPLPQTVTVNSPPQENDLAVAQSNFIPFSIWIFLNWARVNKAKLALLRQEYKELKENQAKVTSLRQEYNEMKENASLLKIEIDSNSSSVQGIDDQISQLKSQTDDDQISQLKSQQAELTKTIETKKMARLMCSLTRRRWPKQSEEQRMRFFSTKLGN